MKKNRLFAILIAFFTFSCFAQNWKADHVFLISHDFVRLSYFITFILSHTKCIFNKIPYNISRIRIKRTEKKIIQNNL